MYTLLIALLAFILAGYSMYNVFYKEGIKCAVSGTAICIFLLALFVVAMQENNIIVAVYCITVFYCYLFLTLYKTLKLNLL